MYIGLDEAQNYFDTVLNTEAWDDATPENRLKALSMATRLIDRLSYEGLKTDEDQENEFPRNGSLDVPESIKEAVCDIALELLDGVELEQEARNLTLESMQFGQAKATYDRSNPPTYIAHGIPSAVAWAKIREHLADPTRINVTRV